MTFGEILAETKKNEDPENIVPLIEDERLRNAVVAWKSVTISFKSNQDCPLTGEVAQWNWLWSQIEYDQQTFGVVAGLKPQDVEPVLTRLIGLRLVYPDGTINTFAKQYLQAIIMSRLSGKRPPGRPKKDDSSKVK